MKTQLTTGLWLAVFALFAAGAPLVAQTPIACGQTITNKTTSASQIDQYSLTGTAGQILKVGFWWNYPNLGGSGSADIYNPSGQLVTNVTALNGGNGITVTLPSDGIYTILVHAATYNVTASYQLSIQSPTGGGCASTPITCGQSVSTNTTRNTQMDAYNYVGTTGQILKVGFWWNYPNLGGSGSADIYNPSGQLVTNLTALNGGNGIAVTLPSDGSYTILVHASTYNVVAGYQLSLQSPTGGGCNSTPIACGQSVSTNTTRNTQMDAYNYVGTTGQILKVGFWWNYPNLGGSGSADIYNPSGQLVTNVTALNGGNGITVTLPSDGIYTILVHAATYNVTASYQLSIQSPTGGGCASTPITCGQSVSTNTTRNTQMDAYNYVGTTGQILKVGFWWNYPNLGGSGSADIYNPSGQLVTNLTALNGGNGIAVTLPSDGSYTILVHASTYNVVAGYQLSLQSPTGGGCNSTPIACGQSVSTNTTRNTQMDAYGFGTGGGTVVLSFSGFSRVRFDLYDPTGKMVFTETPSAGTNITLAEGTYTLLVHDVNYASTGSYGFTVTCLPQCNYLIAPTSVSVGASVTNGSVTVTAGVGCNWTAATNASWLSISSGTSGSGNGLVNFLVEANTSTNARAGTMTIAGWSFHVNQAGAVALVGSDIGNPGAPGSFTFANNIYTVSGSGEDIEDTADDFYFLHTPLIGDGQIVARVTGVTGVNPAAEAGVMIRETLDAGSKHAFLRLDSKTNLVFRRRLKPGAFSVETASVETNRTWLRLMRKGETFIGHSSTNGLDWDYVWFTTLSMSNQVHIGLAVTAHQYNQIATGAFDSVSISALTPLTGIWPLPAPTILLGGETWGASEFSRVGGFKFLVGGVVGDYFTIRSTEDVNTPFSSWQVLRTVTNELGVEDVLDSQALANPLRFYRAQRIGP